MTDAALNVVRQEVQGKYSPPTKRRRESEKSNMNSGESIVFIDGVRMNKSDLWVSQVEDAAENLGNESRPHFEDSVYVRYAAVIKASEDE